MVSIGGRCIGSPEEGVVGGEEASVSPGKRDLPPTCLSQMSKGLDPSSSTCGHRWEAGVLPGSRGCAPREGGKEQKPDGSGEVWKRAGNGGCPSYLHCAQLCIFTHHPGSLEDAKNQQQ